MGWVGSAFANSTTCWALLLDEPAAGLSDDETRELARLVRRLAEDWGMGVLLVEHDVDMVMSVCDQVVVLDFGRRISVGTPDEVRADPAVRAAYLGDLSPRRQRMPCPGRKVIR
jgi:sulfate-transporting ATPase